MVTGGVQTKFVRKFEPVTLSVSSVYNCIKDIIEHQPDEIPLAVTPEAFAKEVLHEVEKESAGKVYVGGGATMARWCYWFLPEWAIVSNSLALQVNWTEGTVVGLALANTSTGQGHSEYEEAFQYTTG